MVSKGIKLVLLSGSKMDTPSIKWSSSCCSMFDFRHIILIDNCLSFFFWPVYCLSVCFQSKASDDSFSIFKLYLHFDLSLIDKSVVYLIK